MASRDSTVEAILSALQPIIPPGFRGKITISVDNGTIRPDDVAVELRKAQPRGGQV